MALRKSSSFAINNTVGNSTLTLVASGGVILSGVECVATSTGAAFTGVTCSIQDSIGTVLFQKSMLAVINQNDFIRLSDINIPTTSNGGLVLVISAVPAAMWVAGLVVYTVP